MRKILCLALLLFSLQQLQAQSQTVSGKVTDNSGSPLPGTSVIIKGARAGTTTMSDGTFRLTLTPGAKTLIFSFSGLAIEEVSINGRSTINVTLNPMEKDLQEVVVVGYGTQKKKSVTSAISRIEGTEIAEVPAPSFDRAIAGKAPGVLVTLGGGMVNAAPRVRIRGINSMTGAEIHCMLLTECQHLQVVYQVLQIPIRSVISILQIFNPLKY